MRNAGVIAVALLLLCPHLAHAYIDPGSGSMLLQVLLGGVAGVVVLCRLYWHRLLALLGRRDDADSIPGTGAPGNAGPAAVRSRPGAGSPTNVPPRS
jgi:hypothetical protein